MRKVRFLAVALLCCLLFGCTADPDPAPAPDPEPMPETIATLDDLIPGVEQAQTVSVQVSITSSQFGTFAWAVANEQERETLLSLLLDADLIEFTRVETGGGAAETLRFEVEEGVYLLDVLQDTDTDVQYLRLTVGEEVAYYEGPAVFSFVELHQTAQAVRTNTEDPDYSGRLTRADGTGEPLPVNKSYTAQAQQILDGTIDQADASETDPGATYDLVFSVGEDTYQINSQTGQFARIRGDETRYATVEEKWQRYLQLYLGYGTPDA